MILLYHLHIVKGGFLAVNLFFVLSSYLSCISASNQKKFSFFSYYKSRFLRLYLPLVIVTLLTILVSSIFSISWLNLKPESTSVLLGYNNFWQLGANADYFARHMDSPFMHLWYISILLQFDIIFPFLYCILKKIGDKIHKILPCLITGFFAILFAIYFYTVSKTSDIMITYYHTFTRVFPLFLGMFLGFIHIFYGSLVFKKLKEFPYRKIIFFIYFIVLCLLFIFIDPQSKLFPTSMILTSLIACRVIDYATIVQKRKLSKIDKVLSSLSSISYEFYLIQYPVIFFFQTVDINPCFKIFSIIGITFFLSYLLHFSLSLREKKYRIARILLLLVIGIVTCFGGYQYVIAEDHTKEMKLLEQQLLENAAKLEEKNKEYENKVQQEQEAWETILNDLEKDEKEIANIVKELPVVGVGDSIMLGAVENLYKKFPNSYFDAKVSRSVWKGNEILVDLKNNNKLGNPVVLNLGANGDCSLKCKQEIMRNCEGHEVFWITVTNDKDVHVNAKLEALAKDYENLHIIDWATISKGHSEYFAADGIHLTGKGRVAYTEAIYDAIYQFYLGKYQEKKEEIFNQHEEELKEKISFYGNSLLLNAFDDIHAYFKDAKFVIKKDFSYETLKEQLQQEIKEGTLHYNVIFAFDKSMKITSEEYQELLSICKDYKVYIVFINKEISKKIKGQENTIFINFYEEIDKNSTYVMADSIHLTEEGNKALASILKEKINKK